MKIILTQIKRKELRKSIAYKLKKIKINYLNPFIL